MNFKSDIMLRKKFDGFDENGNLPYGMYYMTLKELKEIFSNTKRRKEIIKEYEKHLEEIKNTGYFIDHWIDGSFITSKENPNDIDTLTEFNGYEAEKNNKKREIEDLIMTSKSKTKGYCHSFRVYRYPHYEKTDYEYFLKSKIRILTKLFGQDRKGNKKGVIHLIGD